MVLDARRTLASITSSSAEHSSPRPMTTHWSPERLSSLRSGYLMPRPGLSSRPLTPLTSCHVSPVRRSASRLTSRTASTCPSSPSPSSSVSPKHSSVSFTDPLMFKNGGLVTKVQCRIIEAKEVLYRDRSRSSSPYKNNLR